MDCLTPPYFSFQITNDQQTLGYYVGLAVSVEATLMDIGVSAQQKRQGRGQQLLDHFFAQSKSLGCEEAWLEVRESNSAAISLYRKNDFKLIELRKGYYPIESGRENGLIMKRELR